MNIGNTRFYTIGVDVQILLLLLKLYLQKRANNKQILKKIPRLLVNFGLKCVLSGNQVI